MPTGPERKSGQHQPEEAPGPRESVIPGGDLPSAREEEPFRDPEDYPEAGPVPVGEAPVEKKRRNEEGEGVSMKKPRKEAAKLLKGEQRAEQKPSPTEGRLSGGKGRKEEAKGSGVYPASGPLPPGDAVVRSQAEWGQGTRGAEGYEDHGDSEVIPLPPESEAQGEQEAEKK